MKTTKKEKAAAVEPFVMPRYREAKDNKMFPPEMTAVIRFAEYPKATDCKLCGKKKRFFWTMIVPFKAHAFSAFAVTGGKSFAAMTPVCRDHLLEPEA